MRRLTAKSFLSFILVIALWSLPVLLEEAQARGGGGGGRGGGGGGRGGGAHISGGGGYRGGGMGGGGFQGVQRPGPGAGQRPGGGASVQRPGPGAGGAYAGRPGPGGSYQGGSYQGGSYQRNVNVNVDNNWHRGRYGYGGVGRALAVGTVVAGISAAARPVVYGGATYYVDGDTYYKPCYQGDEAAYCVVENPNP